MARGIKRFFGDPTPIQKNYLVPDLLNDADDFELIGSTHIQVGVEEEDSVKETLWLQKVSATEPHLPNAIVAFADLRREDLEDHLAQHRTAANLRGIRQIIGRHPVEDKQNKSGELLHDPTFLRGLETLERVELSFDLQLTEDHYGDAETVIKQVPALKIAICHFASPWDLSRDGYERWRKAITKFADFPNVHFKFSGFGMFKPDWTARDIEPYVECALELFTPDRCMAGSNFPVDKLYGEYNRIWNALIELLPDPDVLKKVTLANGLEFYGVDVTLN